MSARLSGRAKGTSGSVSITVNRHEELSDRSAPHADFGLSVMLRILLCVWTCGVSALLDYYQQVTQQVTQGAATRDAGTSRRPRQLSNQQRWICMLMHATPYVATKAPHQVGAFARKLGVHPTPSHAGASRAAHCEQAHRILGPTTIPFPSSHAQTGRASSQDASTHTSRARETHASQAAKAGRHDQYALRNLARACRWRVSCGAEWGSMPIACYLSGEPNGSTALRI